MRAGCIRCLARAGLAALLASLGALLWLAAEAPPETPPMAFPLAGPHGAEPYASWHHRRLFPDAYRPAGCVRLPSRDAIDRGPPHWQRVRLQAGEVLLYAAHWDERFGTPLVRLLAYATVAPLPPLYCQLWYFRVGPARKVRARVTSAWPAEWGAPRPGALEPYVVTCTSPVPTPPAAVSLAPRPCASAANALRVQGVPLPPDVARELGVRPPPPPPRASSEPSVAVCLKWIDFEADVSVRLTEWLQLLRLFGAERVFVYLLRAHPNVLRVLRHHERAGLVSVTPLWLPTASDTEGPVPAAAPPLSAPPTLKLELLPLNDCLYRAAPRYAWLAALDLDELIVPIRDGDWGELVRRETRGGAVDALVFDNYYFPETDPRPSPGSSLLARVWRSKQPSPQGWFSKSLHNTRSVVAMHNHMPALCGAAELGCAVRHVAGEAARLHHYRDCEPSAAAPCRDLTRDASLQRWRGVRAQVLGQLRAAGLPAPDIARRQH